MDGPSSYESNAGICASPASFPVSFSEELGGRSIGAHLEDKLLPLSLEAADGKHQQEAHSFACTAFPPSVTGLMRYSCTWLFFFPPFSLTDPNVLYRHGLLRPPWGKQGPPLLTGVLLAFAGSTLCS